jgi:hypothetical protein
MPSSKTLGSGYSLVNGGMTTTGLSGGVLWGTTTLTNAILIGKATGTAPSTLGDAALQNAALVAQQAYSIDKKIDDGAAYSGTLRAADGLDATPTDCVAAGATGDYALAITATSCVLAMQVN